MAKEPQPKEGRQPKEQVVDPWNVSAAEGEDKIDYEKLISELALRCMATTKRAVYVANASAYTLMQINLAVKESPKSYWEE